MKTIFVANFPRFSDEIWLPYLWASAKTYYEQYGLRKDEWNWFPCYADVYSSDNIESIKEVIRQAKPDIFAVSLYVWNYTLSYEIAKWVKETWPKCVIISGGPHQYFKHNMDWFKEHWYLDASHPGDCYGELCFTEILDNYDDATATIDWAKVTDIRYPTAGRNIAISKLSMSRDQKKHFDYDWSALATQHNELKKFVNYQYKQFPKSRLLTVLETTRGCPYGCTYCDWGGGTNTTVIKKSLEVVRADIDSLADFKIAFLYLGDANFGIFGDRDVEVIKHIVRHKKLHSPFIRVGYGGFAKTANRLDTIKKIITIDVDNELHITKELKISLQSLDDQVLENIDRKNISLEEQLTMYKPLAKNKKLPLFVEMIMGLPGLTLDKYYYELNVLGGYGLSVTWFEWILLPETPAYANDYRIKYGLETIIKTKGWAESEADSEREVVVGGVGFTKNDYLQMLLSNSLYHMFIKGGFYSNSIDWIKSTHKLGVGDLVRDIYDNYFMLHEDCVDIKSQVLTRWQQIIEDPSIPCYFDVDGDEIYAGLYFVALAFKQPDGFAKDLMSWLEYRYGISNQLIQDDANTTISLYNFSTVQSNSIVTVDYRKAIIGQDNSVHSFVRLFINHHETGQIFKGKRKLFGLLDLK